MSGCNRCGKDLYEHGYVVGDPLDGYKALSTFCKTCNGDVLHERGLGDVADRLRREDKAISTFWTVLCLVPVAFVVLGVLGLVFA
ncbi:MAG: hypothetical protein QOJ79_2451 [Actinomycetota bacterium]|jgi:hypothetical protein|nr:hypothetical protein [Actinomycetota bacterium]